MELFEALHGRRSIRSYAAGEPVSQEQLDAMLAAAMTAPSAGNAQPWQFIVIDDPAILAKIPAFSPYAAMAPKAPLGILVCGDTSLEKYPGYWVIDCAAAVQNLLLAAHGLGLGAVWTGVYPTMDRVEGFRRLLDLPEHIIPHSFIPVGHPAQESKPQNRFKAERAHRNSFRV